MNRQDAATYVEMIRRGGVLIDDPAHIGSLTPDPGDDYPVALARAAAATALVSGDAHLRRLTDPQPPVLTPRELRERIER